MITTLFLDIGGVLLTNGWGTESRKLAAKTFKFDFEEMNSLHRLTFDTYETGKMTLDEYLKLTVFNRKRNFTVNQFKNFMFSQSEPFTDMLALINEIKKEFGLKIVAVSNEGRELNAYRIKKFKLNTIFDMYISSCYVQLRKPDKDIYIKALDISGSQKNTVLYIEDRKLYVEVAESLGIQSLEHKDYRTTKKKLFSLLLE